MAATLPDPLNHQAPIVDPSTGRLTEWGFWFLFSLREGAVSAVQNSFFDTVELVPASGVVIPDLSASGPFGSFHLSSATVVTINKPVWTGKRSVPNGSQITIYFDQDKVGGNPAPLFETGVGGFVDDINHLAIIETLDTRTTYVFGFDGQIWTLKSFQTGETTIPGP